MGTYADGRVECSPTEVILRGYYLPWGAKRIRYEAIDEARRVGLGAFNGRLRIWGTANPRYWAGFDPGRPRKTTGFVLETGHRVRPVVTPDDPDAFAAVLDQHGVTLASGGRAPFM